MAAYVRCRYATCRGPFVVDVRSGGERRIVLPVRSGCPPIESVSVWRDRVAYAVSCGAGGGNGVYVARKGRARRVIRLSDTEAELTPRLDLAPGLVAAASGRFGVRVAATGGPRCGAVVDPQRPPGSFEQFGPLHATRDRIWWVRAKLGAFGGGTAVLETAAIGPGCKVSTRGTPALLEFASAGEIAVDGETLYMSDHRGVVAVPLA